MEMNVAVIGGGVACGAFITALADRVGCLPRTGLFTITVFDPEERVGAGVTYGPRSGKRTKTITPMQEVLPKELLAAFEVWLSTTEHGDRNPGHGDKSQLAKTSTEISIANAYLHRKTVGEFLVANVTTAISKLALAGYPIKHQRESVDWLKTVGETFQVGTTSGVHRFDLVILMNGTPKAESGGNFASSLGQSYQYVSDVYYPSIERNIARISSAAERMGSLDLLIIGSNASAVEAVFLLNEPILSGRVRLTSVSGSGVWPAIVERRCSYPFGATGTTRRATDMVLSQSPRLLDDSRLSAIHDHLEQGDIESAMEKYRQVAQSVRSMSYDDRDYTINTLLPAIVAATRRMGGPYAKCLETLYQKGLLTNIAAKATNISKAGLSHRLTVSCSNGQCIEADYIIDSTGWGSVLDNNILLGNAMKNISSLKLSSGRRGLCVNQAFEAAPRFMVFGPLLAGMNTEEHQLWHLESTNNIYKLAPSLVSSFISILERK